MVLEGVRLVEEALAAGAVFHFVLVDERSEQSERGRKLLERLAASSLALHRCEPSVMTAISDTEAPPGLLAVVSQPRPDLPEKLGAVLVLDGVKDPGNVGACLRTALAAGVGAVLLAPGTADPSAAKVARAALGAHFRLPIVRVSWPDARELCQRHELAVWVADARGARSCYEVDWRRPWALVMGGEAEGPSEPALAMGAAVRIPMPGPTESLNVAAAAAVLLFEAERARVAGDGPA